jgi:hypothetical protein
VPDVSCHDNIVVSASRHLTLEDVSNMLPSNIGNQSLSEVAPRSRQMEISRAPLQELNSLITFVREILSKEPIRR